jgi:membrane-associated protease RseP (regulator of RpoE activity)
VKDPLEEASADVDRRGATKILVAVLVGLVLLGILRPGARDVLLIIAGIVLMVMLHEFGHYLTAKRAGMKSTEFFLGFGPRLWSFRKGETEFGVKAIPAGGYVRILGMSNLEQPEQDPETGEWRNDFRPEDEPRTFRNGSTKNRLIVILAGVTVNLLIALLLFFIVIAGQGRVSDGPSTTVAAVTAKSAAADAGLAEGDKIVAVDGVPIDGWEELKASIESHGGQETTFTIERDGAEQQIVATPGKRNGEGFLGVAPTNIIRDVGVLEAVPESFRAMGDITAGTASGLADFFSPSGFEEYSKNFTGGAPAEGSPEANARPRSLIGIVDEGSQIIDGNVWSLLWLLGALSLVLALFNLIPLLPFDGGHAVIVVYEAVASKIKGRRIHANYAKLMPITAVVLAIFLTIGLSTMFLDIKQAVGN